MVAATTTLDERSREVLRTLIHLHIQTGEPVGSETLSRQMGRGLSSASIRNTLAELERLGFLDHPHTSAGRLPTDEGYRFYVDTLITHRPLPEKEAAAIDSALRPGDASPTQMMESASHLLSQLTRNVGFVLAPDISGSSFRHIDLVPLPPPRVLVVMVSANGLITNKVIELDEQLPPEQLQECANYLNQHFAGLHLGAIRQRLLELMREEKAAYDRLLHRVVTVGERAFSGTPAEGSLYLDGTSHILDQAHGEDLERLRSLFRTFEEKTRLVKILNACIGGEGLRILIGRENPEPGLRGMALIAATCPVGGEGGFGVGVLGSTRMEYARVIALVDHVSRAFADALSELGA
jgi:heat-inducible transcriptional repressor